MNPRAAILSAILALTLLAPSVPSHAQQPGKVYRIGFLGGPAPSPDDTSRQQCPIKGSANWQALVEGLRERGYIPGQNLVLECRFTEGQDERSSAIAAELVRLRPDLFIASGASLTRAAKQATRTIPIVMVGVYNPVERGFITSLAHPGGNLTGLTETVGVGITGKSLQLLKEAIPTLSRVALLYYAGDPLTPPGTSRREAEAAARPLGLTLQPYAAQEPAALEIAFSAMIKGRAEALLVMPAHLFSVHAQRIADLAIQSRLPGMSYHRSLVEAGGLMSYAVDERAMYRRVGSYVDKIFHGTKPADLPVEQPTKFELLINLKTAKTLGLTIPQSLLSRADVVIE